MPLVRIPVEAYGPYDDRTRCPRHFAVDGIYPFIVIFLNVKDVSLLQGKGRAFVNEASPDHGDAMKARLRHSASIPHAADILQISDS